MSENHKSIFEKALENLNHPLSMRLSESLTFEFGTSEQASRFADEAVRARLAASTDQFKSMYGDYMVELSTNSGSSGSPTMTHKDLAKLMRKHNGKLHNTNEGSRIKSVFKENVQLDEGSEIEFKFSNPMKAGAFMRRIMRDKLASEVDRYDGDRSPEEIVQVIMHPNDYERNDIERLAKQYKGELREDLQLDENVQNQVKRMDRQAKEKLAKTLNDLDLSGYGDYEARIDNVHKFKPSDLKMAMQMMGIKEDAQLVEDRTAPRPPLEFDPRRYMDDDGDGIPNYDDPDYPRDPRYYPGPHPDNIQPPILPPEIPDVFNPNVPGGPFSNPFGYKRPAPGFYDPAFDPYSPALPYPGATEPLDPPTEPVIPGTNPSSPFPFGLPYPYRPNTNPFAPGQPFSPEIAGTQTESMKLDERAKVPTYVIDRKTKKIVHGPTDTADAKLYLNKQIQPRKFMIRQIRGAAKKVGDSV